MSFIAPVKLGILHVMTCNACKWLNRVKETEKKCFRSLAVRNFHSSYLWRKITAASIRRRLCRGEMLRLSAKIWAGPPGMWWNSEQKTLKAGRCHWPWAGQPYVSLRGAKWMRLSEWVNQ